MEIAGNDYRKAKSAGDHGGMSKAKMAFIHARGKLGGLITTYSRQPPCGKGEGDLLEDMGNPTIPEFPT